ncbi:MAG TPA: glycosyltransferase [Candidatus Limnocylindrales bacterium]|nr:glycosyltransferase [Candidatus Limnocylindrales bacterium]
MLEQVAVPPLELDAFAPYAGEPAVEEIRRLAEPLRGARVLHVNATKFGGGVAEILPTLTALMRDAGLDAEWRVIPGDDPFFDVTKRIHNGLQGMAVPFDDTARETFRRASRGFADAWEGEYDYVVIHDPQPAAIRGLLPDAPGKWIWRCHIDLTAANAEVWGFLRPEVEQYDAAIFTLPDYVQPDLQLPVKAFVAPSIDPLSPKNMTIEPQLADDVTYRFGVDPHRPLLLQVSRFDPWKDPTGVIDVYRLVKREIPDVQLSLVGSMATDDPEGWRLYREVLRYAGQDSDLTILTNLDGVGSLEVNAFQHSSEVVLQKSLREGFGLTVAEALWKRIPVVGGRVGGIPMQIGEHDEAGRLVTSVDEAAAAALELLRDEELRKRLGEAGRERVRLNFLSTRNLRDYLSLFNALRTGEQAYVPDGIDWRPPTQ